MMEHCTNLKVYESSRVLVILVDICPGVIATAVVVDDEDPRTPTLNRKALYSFHFLFHCPNIYPIIP